MSTIKLIENPNTAITEIVAPSISDINYASNLSNVFGNINDNFIKLANHEFVKGDAGDSVEIVEWKLFNEDGTPNTYGKLLKECIMSISDKEDEYKDIVIEDTTFTIWDKFNMDNGGIIHMVCNVEHQLGESDKIYVPKTSLYYVFLDGRYANTKIGLADESNYINTRDFSCILVYNGATQKFEALNNAFPTIYYENGVGLCWKINGNGSGIPVQGVPGRNGTSATLFIVKADKIETSEVIGIAPKGKVTGIYESYFGYRSIEDWSVSNDINSLDQQSALILSPNTEENVNGNLFYFGKIGIEKEKSIIVENEEEIEVENDVLYVYCSPDTAINTALNNESVINAMKSINVIKNGSDVSMGMKGLFIPLEDEDNNKQKVHLLTSTSITNRDGNDTELRSDVLLTPVNNINNINVSQQNPLQVDKYLYLRLNTNWDFANNALNALEPNKHNYCFKYKLAGIVSHKESEYFKKSYANFYESNVQFNGTIKTITPENVVYLSKIDGDKYIFTDNYIDSIPENFKRLLAENNDEVDEYTHGIYRWELDTTIADYDPTEIRNSVKDSNSYTFNSNFNNIYTTTLTPSSVTDFMWFNHFELVFGYENKYASEEGENKDKCVIYGWNSTSSAPVFEFIKFVPIYNNWFAVNTDTALNLNYNVNITGDADNPNKSITVHGDVNCDNLSVYSLTASKEIKNVHTPDDIYGEKGIFLCKSEDSSEYEFKVNSGNISANTIDISGEAILPIVNSKQTDSDEISTKDLTIGNESNINAGSVVICESDLGVIKNESFLDIEANKINKLTLKSSDLPIAGLATINDISKIPLVNTDMPIHYNNNGNIVLSNQDDYSDVVYFKNTPALKDNNNPGPGVETETGNGKLFVNKTSFESAKNFNMQRLSLSQVSGGETRKFNNETTSTLGTNSNVEKTWALESTCSRRSAYAYGNTLNPNCTSHYPKGFADSDFGKKIDTFEYIVNEKQYMQVSEIKYNSNYPAMNRSTKISISFNTPFFFHIGLKTGNSYGDWGQLHKDSKMWLEVWYSSGDEKIKKLPLWSGGSERYFPTGYSWVGHNVNANKISGYSYIWRYYTHCFKPNTLYISTDSEEFKEMCKDYDNGNNIKIYVVPRFHIKGCSEKGERIEGIRVTIPRAYNGQNSYYNTISCLNSDKGIKLGETVNTGLNKNSLTYYLISSSMSDSVVKTNTICNDGMVIRAGEYVFGLGYAENIVNHKVVGYGKMQEDGKNPHWQESVDKENYKNNIPVLFYHKIENGYYNNKKEPNKTNRTTAKNNPADSSLLDSKGYALRTNAIPLQDIFELIKVARLDSKWEFGI